MARRTKSAHITPAGGNIFADLGFEKEDAELLLGDADRRISDKLAIKLNLMLEINDWIEKKDIIQEDAARILGITRPRVSDVVQQKTEKFSIDALVDMVERTGKRVGIAMN